MERFLQDFRFGPLQVSLRIGGNPELAVGTLVTGNYFDVPGGRGGAWQKNFLQEEAATRGPQV